MASELPIKSDASEQHASKPRRGKAGLIAAILMLALAIVLARVAAEFDRAMGNVVFALGTLIALAILYVWLLLRRGTSWKARLLISIAPLVFVGIVAALFRIEGFSGELVPQFRGRWHKQSSSITTTIASKPTESANEAGKPTEPASIEGLPAPESEFYRYSSTQFFGNNRNGIFPDVELQTDWKANPPKEVWRVPIGAGWASFSIKDGLAVTLEQSPDAKNENVIALRLEDGKPLWVVRLEGSHYRVEGGGGPRTTPAIDGDNVIALSSVGKLVSINLKSGSVRWKRDLLEEANVSLADFEKEVSWGRSNSPLIVGSIAVVPVGGGADATKRSTLVAYNKDTGEIVWRAGTHQISYSSPLLMKIDGLDQIVYTDEKTVAGYTIDTGKQLWSYPWSSHSNGDASVSQSALIDEHSLFLSKGYFVGCARIEVKCGSDKCEVAQIWSSDKSLKTKFTSCVLKHGCAFGLNDGRLECVELETGKRRWMKGRYGHGQVLMCGDNLLISSEEGELVLVAADPKEFRELAVLPVLDGTTWNIPTLAGDLVLTRNAKEAVCLRLPVKSAVD